MNKSPIKVDENFGAGLRGPFLKGYCDAHMAAGGNVPYEVLDRCRDECNSMGMNVGPFWGLFGHAFGGVFDD